MLASVASLMLLGPYLLIPVLILLRVRIVGIVEALLIAHQLLVNNSDRLETWRLTHRMHMLILSHLCHLLVGIRALVNLRLSCWRLREHTIIINLRLIKDLLLLIEIDLGFDLVLFVHFNHIKNFNSSQAVDYCYAVMWTTRYLLISIFNLIAVAYGDVNFTLLNSEDEIDSFTRLMNQNLFIFLKINNF